MWNTDLNLLNEVFAHEGWIYCIAVNPHGKVYSGGIDGTVRLLEQPLTDKETKKVVESREEITSITCDSTRTYSGDDKGVVVCLEDDKFMCRIETSEPCNGILAKDDLIYTIRDRG